MAQLRHLSLFSQRQPLMLSLMFRCHFRQAAWLRKVLFNVRLERKNTVLRCAEHVKQEHLCVCVLNWAVVVGDRCSMLQCISGRSWSFANVQHLQPTKSFFQDQITSGSSRMVHASTFVWVREQNPPKPVVILVLGLVPTTRESKDQMSSWMHDVPSCYLMLSNLRYQPRNPGFLSGSTVHPFMLGSHMHVFKY